MTSATARPRRSRSLAALALACALGGAGCASFSEVTIETPLQSRIDVEAFRRVLVAGFVTDLGESDVNVSSETMRLLQNQLRTQTRMQVLEPDHPPLDDALEKVVEKLGEGGKYSKADKDQYKLETDQVLQDGEFWRRVGEEFQGPLIVTGRLGFEVQNRSATRSTPSPGWSAAAATWSARPTACPPSSCSSMAATARCCTRRSSPRKCSTARTRRSRRSPRTSS